MPDFTVIVADIKASRKMRADERYEGQLFLKSAIIQVNETYASAIEAPFMITKGDEIQGVLCRLADVNRIMLKLERLIFPLTVRFGLGFGPIQKMGSSIPIEMDGPAFHRASQALDVAKKKKLAVYVNTGNRDFDTSVNTIYQLVYAIKRRWSDISFERYWRYKELGTYERVAEASGVSVQAVWDSLRNARAMDVIEAENTLDRFFSQHDEQPVKSIRIDT